MRAVNVSYVNFSKAFIAVFHSSLIVTSHKYRLGGWTTQQRKDLLDQQPSHSVKITIRFSSGSILGQIQFNSCTSDLAKGMT